MDVVPVTEWNISLITFSAGFSFFNTEELSQVFEEFYKREKKYENEDPEKLVVGPSRITAEILPEGRPTTQHNQVSMMVVPYHKSCIKDL